MSLDDFLQLGIQHSDNGNIYYMSVKFVSRYGGKRENYIASDCYEEDKGKYKLKKYVELYKNRYTFGFAVGYEDVLDIFPVGIGMYAKKHMIPVSLEEIYDVMKPQYIQQYLANGKKYKKEYQL